jgi:exosortase
MVYGFIAFKSALFPLLFLVFIIPIPSIILDPVIRFLQVFSAHAVHLAFNFSGLPFFREDMTFKLPGIAIEIAKECSGIRSSLALLISSILAGHMFLCSAWRKITLISFIVPVTIIKNAIRITTLTLLAIHIDKSWLSDSWLHKSGGIVFFLLALILLSPVLWLLVHSEQKGLFCKDRRSRIRSQHL